MECGFILNSEFYTDSNYETIIEQLNGGFGFYTHRIDSNGIGNPDYFWSNIKRKFN